jgi:hypothetical protein
MDTTGQLVETTGGPAEEGADLLVQIVDHVLPVLPPYELSIYLYLLRRSRLVGQTTVRVGKRTIGEDLGKGTLPTEVPVVRERMAVVSVEPAPNYYRDPVRRRELLERDRWLCRYCGSAVTTETATLDHIVPVSRGGSDEPENLATACLTCNSIKSGRSYEDAAPQLLEALRRRSPISN